jgi:hypothetical protein
VIAGVDVSSFAVDVVFVEDFGNPIWVHVGLGKEGNAFDRARGVLKAMRNAVSEDGNCSLRFLMEMCSAVGIEEPRGFNPGPAFRVQGAVLQFLHPDSLVQPWVPSQWRKKVGLKGNCTKDEIKEFVYEALGEKIYKWPQDACDAWCIAEATRFAVTSAS